jgi:hypothetical protein
MVVSAADVTAGVQKEYDIQGESRHAHTVTLTADHFTTLQNGGTVTVMSSTDGVPAHPHEITVTCA